MKLDQEQTKQILKLDKKIAILKKILIIMAVAYPLIGLLIWYKKLL